MKENAFRQALDECLERIRGGDSLEECLAAHPEQAPQLGPFLRSASILWNIRPQQPAATSITEARNRLLARVAEGSRGKEAVMRGVFRYGHTALAVAALFVTSLGLVAAAGTGMLPGGGSNTVTFNARVVSTSPSLFFVQREDDQSYVYLRFNDGTRFEDAAGTAIAGSAIARNGRVGVEATSPTSGRIFDTQMVRLVGAAPTPAPTPGPTTAPAAEPTPEPTKPPEAEPTVKPTQAPEATTKPTEAPKTLSDFFGTVVAVGESHLVVATDTGNVLVHTSAETQYPNGFPFVGVKVGVLGYKNADGSYDAVKVIVKVMEFSGVVKAINGSDLTVFSSGVNQTVHTDGHTNFPTGHPVVNDEVFVRAWKLGDGTFLATDVKVTPPAATFSGVIVGHFPGEFTICVEVAGYTGSPVGPCTEFGAGVKTVCYEFAEVIGELAVGKTVDVYKDHVTEGTYFAYKIVVH